MASEFDFRSEKKCKAAFDEMICIFCAQPFHKTLGVTPDLSKIDSLFGACRERLDDVAKQILEHELQILNGRVTFRYHRNCRSTYCSKTHVQRAMEKRRASLTQGDGETGGGDGVHCTA